MNTLKVNEIFTSISGEVCHFHQGQVCTFIRLSGCNLKCKYCDTYHEKNFEASVTDIINILEKLESPRKFIITGGEPLLQQEGLIKLYNSLPYGKKVVIETNGSIPIKMIHPPLVIDYKLPSSGMQNQMIMKNFYFATKQDWIKFVISNKNDYKEAKFIMTNIQAHNPDAQFAFSPAMDGKKILCPWLVGAMIKDRIDAVYSLQIHKLIGVQ